MEDINNVLRCNIFEQFLKINITLNKILFALRINVYVIDNGINRKTFLDKILIKQ